MEESCLLLRTDCFWPAPNTASKSKSVYLLLFPFLLCFNGVCLETHPDQRGGKWAELAVVRRKKSQSAFSFWFCSCLEHLSSYSSAELWACDLMPRALLSRNIVSIYQVPYLLCVGAEQDVLWVFENSPAARQDKIPGGTRLRVRNILFCSPCSFLNSLPPSF